MLIFIASITCQLGPRDEGQLTWKAEHAYGIGRFITNQQNIYRVTPVHYLQRQRKRHEKEQYNIEGEKREFMATTFVC